MEMITDFMWEEIEKILPKKQTSIGRPPNDRRKTMNGIFYVLKTGAQWKYLPKEYGARSSVHGTFMKWARDGVFEQLLEFVAVAYLKGCPQLPNWFATDTSSSKAPFAQWGGKNPTDRSKRGIKKGIIVDRKGAPLVVSTGAAHTHDSKFYKALLLKLKKLPLPELNIMAADAAYDSADLRKDSKENGFILLAATNPRRKKGQRLYKPPCRWVVERTFGWFNWHRGLKTCWAKTAVAFTAMLAIAASNQLFRML